MNHVSNAPVLVGVAQVLQRTDDLAEVREPLALMIDAARRAAEDAGAPGLLARAGAVRVVRGVWRYQDPGRAVAAAVGCPGAKTTLTSFGGNGVQQLVNRSCLEILDGRADVVLITGAEWGRSSARAKRVGVTLSESEAPGTPDDVIGEDLDMIHPAEDARGLRMPIQMYAIFETALRHALGESVEDHAKRVANLWASFSDVASRNPSAWIQEAKSAEEIGTPGPTNRAVSSVYPMLMNSNSRVDMGAALILCSEKTAKQLGVPREKWIYPHSGTDAVDPKYASIRDELHGSPGIRIAGARVLELAGVAPSELDHVDIYSCFPSAVQVAARELGLPTNDPKRPLTVTGGLTFGGGPMNNYVMHSIARMAEVLRDDTGSRGLVTANGGFLSKHAFGLYSSEPNEGGYRYANVQDQVDALPTREALVDHDGEVEIESYVVMMNGEEPGTAYTACRTPEGCRSWATVEDPSTAAAMTREEFCGRSARIDGAGHLSI